MIFEDKYLSIPGRYWEPEDDRTDEELYEAYLASEHSDEDPEIPFD